MKQVVGVFSLLLLLTVACDATLTQGTSIRLLKINFLWTSRVTGYIFNSFTAYYSNNYLQAFCENFLSYVSQNFWEKKSFWNTKVKCTRINESVFHFKII